MLEKKFKKSYNEVFDDKDDDGKTPLEALKRNKGENTMT